jgi:hypothetical protein
MPGGRLDALRRTPRKTPQPLGGNLKVYPLLAQVVYAIIGFFASSLRPTSRQRRGRSKYRGNRRRKVRSDKG